MTLNEILRKILDVITWFHENYIQDGRDTKRFRTTERERPAAAVDRGRGIFNSEKPHKTNGIEPELLYRMPTAMSYDVHTTVTKMCVAATPASIPPPTAREDGIFRLPQQRRCPSAPAPFTPGEAEPEGKGSTAQLAETKSTG